MKTISQQMMLFGTHALDTLPENRGAFIAHTYKKAGKKWAGDEDEEGFALTPDGEKIVLADHLTFLPTLSKKNDDMKDLTGLEGKELRFHALDLRQRALTEAYKIVSGLLASGQYTSSNKVLTRRANGEVVLRMRPTQVRVIRAELTRDELVEQAAKLGLVLATAPAPAPEAPAPEAPKVVAKVTGKGKGKTPSAS